jgi:transcriptional regulator with XRE-family HTH domain
LAGTKAGDMPVVPAHTVEDAVSAAPAVSGEPSEETLGRASGAFGEVLRDLRVTRGVSQAQLATRAGMDRSYVNRMEAGERGAPAPAATEALARALDLSSLEADRLFIAAGLLPRSLRTLGADDPTILLLAQRLADPRLSVAARAALRATVETIARCWSNPVAAMSAGSEGSPARAARS